MVSEKDQIRSVILFLYKTNKTAKETHQQICNVFGNDSITLKSIYNWFKRFDSGLTDLDDEPRSGRPSVVNNDQLIVLVMNCSMITLDDISYHTGLAKSTIWDALQRLGFSYKLNRWLPHSLTAYDKRRRVDACTKLLAEYKKDPFFNRLITCDEKWVLYDNSVRGGSWSKVGDRAAGTPKQGLTSRKILLCVFWDRSGVVHHEYLKSGETLTAEVYCEQLDRLYDQLKKKRPHLVNRKGVLLQQDNAKPHNAVITQAKLWELNIETVIHPAYSPDMAPSDYHLFLAMHNHFAGAKFNSKQETISEVDAFLHRPDHQFFKSGIEKLPERWSWIIENGGEYFFK